MYSERRWSFSYAVREIIDLQVTELVQPTKENKQTKVCDFSVDLNVNLTSIDCGKGERRKVL